MKITLVMLGQQLIASELIQADPNSFHWITFQPSDFKCVHAKTKVLCHIIALSMMTVNAPLALFCLPLYLYDVDLMLVPMSVIGVFHYSNSVCGWLCKG